MLAAIAVWLAGTLVAFWSLTVSIVRARRLIASAQRLDDAPGSWAKLGRELSERLAIRRPIPILQEKTIFVPMVFGFGRPVVILPPDCRRWSDEERRGILLHELSHAKRRDPLWLLTARLTTALVWFHPLAWFVAKRLRVEREFACDDAVLLTGEFSDVYASSLLDVARQAAENAKAPAFGVAMARRESRIAERVASVLDAKKNRRPIGRFGAFVSLLLAVGAILGTAKLAPVVGSGGASGFEKPSDFVGGSDSEKPSNSTSNGDAGSKSVVSSRYPEKTTVHVVDESGNPIPNAPGFHRFGGNINRFITDENGVFVIPAPKPEDESRSVDDFSLYPEGFGPFSANFRGDDKIPTEFVAVLKPAQKTGGFVVDEEGKPIEGGEVAVYSPHGSNYKNDLGDNFVQIVRTTTAADGSWSVFNVPADFVGSIAINLSQPDRLDQLISLPILSLQPDAAGRFSEKTTFENGVPLEGIITDESRKPIVGATVVLGGTQFENLLERTTDAEGRFRFDGLGLTDGIDLFLRAPGFAVAKKRVAIQRDAEPVQIVMKPGRAVAFHVVDKNGEPIENAFVASTGIGRKRFSELSEINMILPEAKTDSDGRFVWTDAPKETFWFTASAANQGYWESREFAVGPDENDVSVTLYNSKFSVEAADEATGEKIDSFSCVVQCYDRADDELSCYRTLPQSSREGVFSFWGGRVEALRFDVSADGYETGRSELVREDEDSRKIVVFLKKSAKNDSDAQNDGTEEDSTAGLTAVGSIASGAVQSPFDRSLEILTPDGKPASGATIAVAVQDSVYGGNAKASVADSMGRFVLSSEQIDFIGPCRFALKIEHSAGVAIVSDEEFEAKLNDESPIRLQKWGRIEGTFQVGTRLTEGVALQTRFVSPDGFPEIALSQTVRTGVAGKFAIERVAPGRNVFSRLVSGWSQACGEVEVKSGETTVVALGGDGRPVVGRVASPKSALDDVRKNPYSARLVRTPKSPFETELFFPPTPEEIRFNRDDGNDVCNLRMFQWLQTDEGRAWKERLKRYNKTLESFRPTRLDSDGNFRFDDVPEGDWTLVVSADANCGMEIEAGAWRYVGSFVVPATKDGRSDEPLDLGGLQMSPTDQTTSATSTEPTTSAESAGL